MHGGQGIFDGMKRLLLLAVVLTLGGCAFMSDEDKDFYGRGWVKPSELDNPYPNHAGTPGARTPAVAPSQGSDPAWDVPPNDAVPVRAQ